MNNLIYFEHQTIYSAHLPWVTVGVGITIESIEKDKKIAGRYVLLDKECGVLDSLST